MRPWKGDASVVERTGAETEAHDVVLVELSLFGGDTPSSLRGDGGEEKT